MSGRARLRGPVTSSRGRDDDPTDYVWFVYCEMATPYAKGVTPAVREAMRQVDAWFANRAATWADLVPAHLARARELYAQGGPGRGARGGWPSRAGCSRPAARCTSTRAARGSTWGAPRRPVAS